MNRFAIPLFASLAMIGGCSKSSEPGVAGPTTSAALTEVPGMARYALAEPISVNNVSIVPVVSRENIQGGPEYATLAEAKKNAWIEIIEEGEGGEVQSLIVKNVGPKPILLLAGELLLGGKQDRVVAKDTIVPTNKEVVVPVYCVEPGRWSGDSNKFSYGETSVPLRVREQALYGDQEAVWDNVGSYNSAAGAPDDGRTTIQKGLFDEEVQATVDRELANVVAALGRQKNVVGVIFLIDGKIQTLELFGNDRLFRASQAGLLKGALAEAAVNKGKRAPRFALEDCAKFMAEAMESDRVVESRTKFTGGEAVSARRASPEAKGLEIHHDDDSGDGGSVLVHGSYSRQ